MKLSLRESCRVAPASLAFFTWLALFPARAAADATEVRASLAYEVLPGADACPTERTLREQVALRLGYDPFHEDAQTHVRVRLAPRRGGLTAVISTEQPGQKPASRTLESDGTECDELLRSVVLTVSLAIDPLSLTRALTRATPAPTVPPAEPAVPVAPPPSPPPEPVPAPPTVVAPAKPTSPKVPWTFEVSGRVRAGFGLLPGDGSVGPLVDLRVGKGSWAILAEGGVDVPTGSATNAKTGPGSIQASLTRGGLGACDLPAFLLLCARVDVGELDGTGQGSTTTTSTSLFLGAAVDGGIDVHLVGDVRALLLAELDVPLTRTTLSIKNGPLWESSTLAAFVSAGLGYRF